MMSNTSTPHYSLRGILIRAAGLVFQEPRSAPFLLGVKNHPVCAAKERDQFINGAATPPWKGGEWGVFLVLFLFFSAPLFSAANQILCAVGANSAAYNAYSDERPTPDAMELAAKVNAGLGAICRPNCPTMAMFRNTSAANIMLLVATGQAKIVYKPEFFTTVFETFGDPGIMALIAHEVGHAMDANGTAKWMKPGWNPELRADAWAGCAFAKMNMDARYLRSALNALQKYPPPSYPDWGTRLSVVRTGYTECGGTVAN